MPKPKRLNYRELVRKLKKYNIIVITKRAKGSERMLYHISTRNDYPIKYRGKNYVYSIGTLKAIQRRFSLPDDFLF